MTDGETYTLTGCRFGRREYDGFTYCYEHGDFRDPSRYVGPCDCGRAAWLEEVSND